ncbi:MAG: polysaccharide deacetylase family protein [Firmicutes bacterium]|nr:polysaccharide deacetylase family protein [Bacillota bacterium]
MFIVLISSRKKLISILFLILICGAFLFKNNLRKYFYGVKPNVMFLQEDLGGYTRDKVKEVVATKFERWEITPVDALYDPHSNHIVPELWGYEVNIQDTVDKIMEAPKGGSILPVYNPVFPDVTVEDYPSAIIAQGNPEKKQVSFMINVAWGTEHVLPMLEILSAERCYATFFLVGKWAKQNVNLVDEINVRGNLLGNHGHTDSVVYTELSKEEIENGLKEVNDIVYAVTGKIPVYFTPHKGEYNDLVLEVASRQGIRTVLWSLDTVDWDNPGVEKMKAKIIDNLHGGAIILMHPTAETVTFIKDIIPIIKNKGYNIVTINELLSPHYPPDKRE